MSPQVPQRTAVDEVEDPELVAALSAGDLSAFERIIREHGRVLLAVARRLLRNDDDARTARLELLNLWVLDSSRGGSLYRTISALVIQCAP